MSEEEHRAPKRPRREETPEEERKMLAEYVQGCFDFDRADGAAVTVLENIKIVLTLAGHWPLLLQRTPRR